nr:MAG TPA: hypothetical protein [Caudoviricetes sp.]
MKLITKGVFKVFNYNGVVITAPGWAAWIAVDMDGALYVYDNEPFISDGNEFWSVDGTPDLLGYVDLDGADWRKTLMKC